MTTANGPHSRIEPASAADVTHITTGFNTLSRCRYGWMMYHATDRIVGRSLHKYGEFSEAEVSMFAQLVRPGHLVIDAGANFGAHTVAFAHLVGPRGRVFAFEPQTLVFQALAGNVAINSLHQVVTLNAALGKTPGTIRVPLINPTADENFGSLSIEGGFAEGEEVPIQTIDGLGVSSCRLIKIDVQGMESDVLEGAKETIARLRPFLYIENDQADRSPNLIRTIQAFGYRLWWHLPFMYNPDNFRGDSENVFDKMVSINMLCLPKELDITIDLAEITSPESRWQAHGRISR